MQYVLVVFFYAWEQPVGEHVRRVHRSLSLRIAEAVALWIRTARAELVKDSTFLKALTQLQDMLMKDGLLEALQVLNTSLSESIRFSSSPNPAGNMLIPLKVSEAGRPPS